MITFPPHAGLAPLKGFVAAAALTAAVESGWLLFAVVQEVGTLATGTMAGFLALAILGAVRSSPPLAGLGVFGLVMMAFSLAADAGCVEMQASGLGPRGVFASAAVLGTLAGAGTAMLLGTRGRRRHTHFPPTAV